jgi:hypothetical protein
VDCHEDREQSTHAGSHKMNSWRLAVAIVRTLAHDPDGVRVE